MGQKGDLALTWLESLMRKAISEDGVSVAVKGPGLRRSWAEVKVWLHGQGHSP